MPEALSDEQLDQLIDYWHAADVDAIFICPVAPDAGG